MNNQSVQHGILGNQNVVVIPNNQYKRNKKSSKNKENSKNIKQRPTNNIIYEPESGAARLKNKNEKKDKKKKKSEPTKKIKKNN